MRPTFDEIQLAAYDRWERRGWCHGDDREDWLAAEAELTYQVRYRTLAVRELNGADARVPGGASSQRCRFCERALRHGQSWTPRPVFAEFASPLTLEVCDDCQSDWRDDLDAAFHAFWSRLTCDGRATFTVAAYKSLTAATLLLLAASELRYFVDAIEWVANPDHDSDDQLLEGAGCRAYRAPFLGHPPRATLARRVNDETPVPYMLAFVECGGMMLQIPLPMCLRDEDLDGRTIEQPERRVFAGYGPGFHEATVERIPLTVSSRRDGRSRRRAALAS